MVLLKCTFQEVSCTLPQMFYLDSLYCLQDTTVWYEVAGILMPVPHFFFFLDFSTTLSFTTVSYNLGCCYNQIINGVRYSSVVLINQSVRLECKGVTTQTLRQDHRNSMARILLEIILLILAFFIHKNIPGKHNWDLLRHRGACVLFFFSFYTFILFLIYISPLPQIIKSKEVE